MIRFPKLPFRIVIYLGFSINLFSQGLSTPTEFGTTINPIGSGARALGQGNAFIAVADDATAASWNPAGLTQLQKPEFSFALEALNRRSTLQSTAHPESEGTDSNSFENFNYASLVYPYFYKRNMVFSLNYLKLYSFDNSLRYPFDLIDANTQFTFDQEGAFSVLAPAFAVNITDRISLGMTVNFWHDSLTQSSHYTKTQREVQTALDGTFRTVSFRKDHVEIESGYSIVLGAIYRLNKQWSIASVVKPAFELDLDHAVTTHFKQTGVFGLANDDHHRRIDATLDFPWIIGIGTAWRPTDPLTISMDATWTQWSEFTINEEGQRRNPLTAQSTAGIDEESEDTFTLRLGGEYLFIFEDIVVPIRCGLGYDPAPAVKDVDDFYTLNAGFGIQFLKRFNLDFGYEFRWGNNVNSDIFSSLDASQDIKQHRFLTSLIVYF